MLDPKFDREFAQYDPYPMKSIELPDGSSYQPRAAVSHVRYIRDVPVVAYNVNTPDEDMEALFWIARFAGITRLFVKHDEVLHFAELGSWCGESAVAIGSGMADALRFANLSAEDSKLWCIDHFQGSPNDWSSAAIQAFGCSTLQFCQTNTAQISRLDFGPKTEILQLDSQEAAVKFPDHLLAFLFVDAGHTRAEVQSDLQRWLPKMAPGSIIAGHDYGSLFPGVVKAVDDFCLEQFKHAPLLVNNSRVWYTFVPDEPTNYWEKAHEKHLDLL